MKHLMRSLNVSVHTTAHALSLSLVFLMKRDTWCGVLSTGWIQILTTFALFCKVAPCSGMG